MKEPGVPAGDLPTTVDGEDIARGREATARYLRWVRALLEEIVVENGETLLVNHLLLLALDAWELAVRERFDVVATALLDPEEVTDDEIEEHGLFGAQLRFKLAVVDRWYRRWRDGECSLHWLLVKVNDILDSIPGGGGLGEFKDAADGALL